MEANKVIIDHFTITTGCGKSKYWKQLKELKSKDFKILNDIGYGTIKNISFEKYLNGLNNGYKYKVIVCRRGDFSQTLIVVRVYMGGE